MIIGKNVPEAQGCTGSPCGYNFYNFWKLNEEVAK